MTFQELVVSWFTTPMGWLTLLLILVGGVGLYHAMKKKSAIQFGNMKVFAGIVSVIFLVVGLGMSGLPQGLVTGELFAVGIQVPQGEVGTPSSIEPTAPQDLVEQAPTEGGASGKCVFVQNTHELKVAVKNRENVSQLGYLDASISAESDGSTHDTGTTTGGTTLSYRSLNVPPCKAGSIYITASSGIGYSSGRVAFSSFDTVSEYEMQGASLDVISILGYDRQGNKKSNGTAGYDGTASAGHFVSGAGTTDGNAYYGNTTLTTGGSIQGQIGLDVNGTSTVFGNYGLTTYNPSTGLWEHTLADDGVIYSYNSVDASKFSSLGSFTLSQIDEIGLKEITCPATIQANREAEKCWKSRTLKDSDGEVLLKFQLKADLGDPSPTGDSPKFCVDDKQYFRGADGKVKYDFYSAGGTNKGVAGVCMTFQVA